MTLVGKERPWESGGNRLLCYAYQPTHAAVALDGFDGSRLSNQGRRSQRNPGGNGEREKRETGAGKRRCHRRRLNARKCFPQMAQQSSHTLPQPANYMLRLALHVPSLPMPTFWREEYALNGIIHLHSHSFQFVSTAQHNAPTVYRLAI